jgi:hypothetical protein
MYLGSAAAGKGTRISGFTTGGSFFWSDDDAEEADDDDDDVGVEFSELLVWWLETRGQRGAVWNGVNAWTVCSNIPQRDTMRRILVTMVRTARIR